MIRRARLSPTLLALVPALALGLVLIQAPAPAAAQDAQTDAAAPDAPSDAPLDGRTFAGVRLPVEPVPGEIDLAAQRAWTWSAQPDGGGPGTTRIQLDNRVQIRLGDYDLRADRAAVWLQPIGVGAGGANTVAYQVYALLENARTVDGAAISVRSELLPVEAVMLTAEPVRLLADLRLDGPPDEREAARFNRRAQEELSMRLRRLSGLEPMELNGEPDPFATDPFDPTRRVQPRTPALPNEPRPEPPSDAAGPAADDPAPRIFRAGGVFYFSAGDRVAAEPGRDERGEPETAVILSGGVNVQYESDSGSLEMRAERAVVFLRGEVGPASLAGLTQDDVSGLYLEGGVYASDGSYTLRAPRVFYDVNADRAIVLDAVFQTFSPQLQAPVYVRAKALKQESADQFTADKATVANTAFFRPHLALGATDVTVTRRVNRFGEERPFVDARNITLRGGGTPFFWLPFYRGDPERFPLRAVGFSTSNRTGPAITSSWDLFNLFGRAGPDNVEALVDIDYYFERGAGVGTRWAWRDDRVNGSLLAYTLPQDDGTDLFRSGEEVERDGEFRGIALLQHKWDFAPAWSLIAEGSLISDEALLQALYPDLGSTSNEITSRLLLRRIGDDTVFEAGVQAATTDFVPTEALLQSSGYQVDRLPTIGVYGFAQDVLESVEPGLLTHTWDANYSALRLRFTEVALRDVGLTEDSRSRRGFGLTPDDTLAERDRALGLDESLVHRFDSRHELAATFGLGPIKINPFVVGRLTLYDDSFDEFSEQEADNLRLWGAAGVRVSTQLQRVDNSIESRTFDLHRMRHIIEPSVTLWTADTTVDSEDLPLYDTEVESLLDGSMIRIGLDQTWQTKRGGPGRWRDVDVFTLDFELVETSDDVGVEDGTTIGRFFGARPELSAPEDFFRLSGTWQVTEAVSLGAETIYDTDRNAQDRTSVGVLLDHGGGLATTSELRFLDNQDVTFWSASAIYEPTDKWTIEASTRYDFDQADFAVFRATFLRAFPDGVLGVTFAFDNIQDETSFGFVIRPGNVGRFLSGGGPAARAGSSGGGVFGG